MSRQELPLAPSEPVVSPMAETKAASSPSKKWRDSSKLNSPIRRLKNIPPPSTVAEEIDVIAPLDERKDDVDEPSEESLDNISFGALSLFLTLTQY